MYPISLRYRYEITDQEEDTIFLKPGEEETLELTLKNKGVSQWDLRKNAKNSFVLSTYLPRNHESIFYDETLEEWEDAANITITDDDDETIILPDEETTFEFRIKAPETPGVYREHFAPKVKGIKGLNNQIITYNIVVEGNFQDSYKYEIVDKNDTETISLNGTKNIRFQVKNTGSVSWYTDGPYPIKLVVDGTSSTPLFYNEEWESDTTIDSIIGDNIVEPDETAIFLFPITSTGTKGIFEAKASLALKDIYVFTQDPLTWNIDATDKMVALTFDDGYGNIQGFLDTLKAESVRATFFILGCVAEARPDDMKQIVQDGHLLASHSYNHPDFRTLGANSVRWQLDRTQDIFEEVVGIDVYPYFRYPYGAHNARSDTALTEDGWEWFHWTNGTGDWMYHANTAAGRNHVYTYATLNPPDKAIVLMHVISNSTLAVLPDIIDYYRTNGYAFVTVDEM